MLLPVLNEELGRLTDKEKRFVAICEAARLEHFLANSGWLGNGRKPKSRRNMARAFLAKALWNLPTTRALIDRLQSDTNVRRLCGWENGPGEVPDETIFSRAFARFAAMGLSQSVHEDLIATHLGKEILWHNATDGTAMEAREKAHVTSDAPGTAPDTASAAPERRPHQSSQPSPRQRAHHRRQQNPANDSTAL